MAGCGGEAAVGRAAVGLLEDGVELAAQASPSAGRVRVRVRAAVPGDLAEMLPIWLAMMRAHARVDSAFVLAPEAEAHWLAWVGELSVAPDAYVLVAELGEGRIAGLAVGWVSDNPPIYRQRQVGFLSELAVAAWARRKGVGTALMSGCRRWFARRQMTEFQLATAVWNDAAQAFWRAMGGREMLVRFVLPTRAPGARAPAPQHPILDVGRL